MKPRYTREAARHLREIKAYIEERSPAGAKRVVAAIRSAVARLEDFPRLGRIGQWPGTFDKPVVGLPYVVIYRIDEDGVVEVVAILHTSRDR